MTVYFFALLNLYLSIIIVVFNVKINKNAIYLAGFLFSLCIFGILHNLTFDEDSPFVLALFRGHFLPAIYAMGPLLYFYVRGTVTDQSKLKKSDYLHFVPSVISYITIIPYLLSPFSYKLEMAKLIIENPQFTNRDTQYFLIPQNYHFYLRALSAAIYSIASLSMLIRSAKQFQFKSVPKSQKNLIIRWLYTLTILSVFIFVCYIPLSLYLIKLKNFPFTISEITYNIVDRISGYSYCVIPLTVLVLPQILYGLPIALSKKQKEEPKDFWADTFTILEEDPFMEVSKSVIEHLKNNKPYLDPEFNIEHLSEQLNIPKHHLYYCFANIIKIKFSKIRNILRVEHAKNLLTEGKSHNLKLEAIGFESGFVSRSHFFATFKEETGLTPSEFLDQLEN
jgi:AraC-like DNA-binding protein